ncbi:MAG: 8-oxo-dGTP diphosphatase [Oscillospiraceae bacterium]|nr:8-oxo-dGTP diphosphatase [Oscillospiraceae bacterium]
MRNTTLVYIEQNESYLMMHRVKKVNDLNHDKWIGIGGKFEEGESPEDCLLREVREETGLTLHSWRYCGIVTFVSDEWGTEYMHLFHSGSFSGTIRNDCEEGSLEWLPKTELLRKELWEGDKIFLRLMEENVSFFSLKLCYRGDELVFAALNGKTIMVHKDETESL